MHRPHMGKTSAIEWTDHLFHPWIGSPLPGTPETGDRAAVLPQRTSRAAWSQPLKWNQEAQTARRRRRVLCADVPDVFDPQADPAWRADLWRLIRRTPFLDWLLLTRHPEAIAGMLPLDWGNGWANVCLLAGAEAQDEIACLPVLLDTPARFRGLALAPLRDAVKLPAKLLKELDWLVVETEAETPSDPPRWTRPLQRQCKEAGVRLFLTVRAAGRTWPLSRGTPFGRAIPEREIAAPLTQEERHHLKRCEKTIRDGLGTFVAVGSALMEIRDARLYRQSHPSFEAYVHSVLALTRPRAYQLIDSAQVMRDLSTIGDISMLPRNEGQARELCRWKTPQERAEKWKSVLEAAKGQPVTARFIRQALVNPEEAAPEDARRRIASCLTRLRNLVAESPAEARALKWIARFEEILAQDPGTPELPEESAQQELPLQPELWLPGFGAA